MKKMVKVGIIGCGAIAERLHAPDYDVCPDAEVVAFCDIAIEKARALADRFAPEAAVYADYNELLSDTSVQAVSVCLPNFLHGPVTIAAAEAGKHVMVEKPMATSMQEARAMIAAAKDAGVLLLVDQCQRRFPAHRKAKEVLDSGELGRILYATAMFGHAGPEAWSPTGTWFFDRDQARFGAMADLGVHKADLLRYLTGKEIAEVAAFYTREEKANATVEDNFASCIKFDDGTIGTLGASWTVKGTPADYIYFHCANGSLRVQVIPDKPVVANFVDARKEVIYNPPAPLNHYEDSWGVDIGGAFVRAILGTEEPFCTGEEGMRSLQVILAAEQAADSGCTVRLQS